VDDGCPIGFFLLLRIYWVIGNTISRSVGQKYVWLKDLCPFLLPIVVFIDNFLLHS
jgi:hypothetical protein